MFFRTKYLVIAIIVAIVLLLIMVLSFSSSSSALDQEAGTILALEFDETDRDYSVEESFIDIDEQREKRLDALTAKIAQISIPAVEEPEPEVEAETIDPNTVGEVVLCSNYQKYNGFWSASGLQFEVVEGARLLSRTTDTGSELVLQLSLFSTPYGASSCLKTDVVGIALDGSLIRNSDYKLYGIFSSETLLGYALDGFPIYGLNSSKNTDKCGGASTNGQYAYYLDKDREGVVGCFAGVPVTI